MIEPDIDVYGSLARASALADYLELLALRGSVCSEAQLRDLIKDKYWTRKRRGLVVDPVTWDDEEFDDAGNGAGDAASATEDLAGYAEEAFGAIAERADVLKDRYPFELVKSVLRVRPGVAAADTPYVSLLCLTAAHAYSVATPMAPEDLLEELVATTLESKLLLVARVGDTFRGNGASFPKTLAAVGATLGIPTTLTTAPHKRFANDMGVDTVAYVSWGDTRLGKWLFIGQVTCASSDEWKQKMAEPAPGLWVDYLEELVQPQAFLAVPHHVEPRTLMLLVHEQRRLVVDRLRFVLLRDHVTADEAQVVDAVLAEPLLEIKV